MAVTNSPPSPENKHKLNVINLFLCAYKFQCEPEMLEGSAWTVITRTVSQITNNYQPL